MATAQSSRVFVQVLYDYQYNDDDGNEVCIKQGEEYTLIKKSNDDWWHVGPVGGHPGDRLFYVPASYVQEIHKSIINVSGENAADTRDETDNSVQSTNSENNTTGEFVSVVTVKEPEPDYMNRQEATELMQKDDAPDFHPKTPSGSMERENRKTSFNYDDTDQYQNLQAIQQNLNSSQEFNVEQEESIYANVMALESPDLPPPTIKNALESTPVKYLAKGWEEHKDEVTGRLYYYNEVTSETTWKPPRLKIRTKWGSTTSTASNESSASDTASSPLSPTSPNSSLKSNSLPRGWKIEVANNGSLLYRNETTQDTWLSSMDEEGRTYYYREDGSESVWDLPEFETNNSSPNFPRIPEDGEAATSPEASPVSGPTPPDSADVKRKPSEVGDKPIVRKTKKKGPAPQPPTQPPSQSSNQKLANQQPLSEPPNQAQDKRGYLRIAKIMEGSKKVKKNWCQMYLILAGPKLLIYKDAKNCISKSNNPYGKPDAILELDRSAVEWAGKEVSSKKNTIQISCYSVSAGDLQYLLQSDETIKIHEWHTAIHGAIQKYKPTNLSRQASMTENGSSQHRSSLPPPGDHPSVALRPPGLNRGGSRFQSTKSSSKYIVSEDPSELSVTERRNKIRERLLKFLRKRPTMETLQEQGIIKESVFGSDLHHLCDRDKSMIPEFIKLCVQAIENKGLHIDGIYRVSGNLAQVQKLRFMVDQSEQYTLESQEWDIHVLTGALKLFFRELKEPVFPFNFFDQFIKAIKIQDHKQRIKAFRDLVKVLPKQNYETLKMLFAHLNRVIEQSHQNRMQVQNIAIVFGPTLLWPKDDSHNIAVSMMFQSNIVEFMLLEYKQIFVH